MFWIEGSIKRDYIQIYPLRYSQQIDTDQEVVKVEGVCLCQNSDKYSGVGRNDIEATFKEGLVASSRLVFRTRRSQQRLSSRTQAVLAEENAWSQEGSVVRPNGVDLCK